MIFAVDLTGGLTGAVAGLVSVFLRVSGLIGGREALGFTFCLASLMVLFFPGNLMKSAKGVAGFFRADGVVWVPVGSVLIGLALVWSSKGKTGTWDCKFD